MNRACKVHQLDEAPPQKLPWNPRERGRFLGMTFAKKLRSLREALHLSRAQLAERAKIPRRTLAQYEQGQREPRWTTFLMLAGALGSPLEEFRECVVATPQVADDSREDKRR